MTGRRVQGAAKACNQLLAKYAKHPLLLVLKAYAFERQGQFKEAFALVDTISGLGTDDDEVLHHVSTLLKSHGKHEQLLALYQTSAGLHPANLGLQQEVFLCHVRLGQVVQQQQVRPRHLCPGLLPCCRNCTGTAQEVCRTPTLLQSCAGCLCLCFLQAPTRAWRLRCSGSW